MKKLANKTEGLINFSDYKKVGSKIAYAIFIFLLIAFVLVAIVPIIWLFITSFKTVNEINSNEYHLFPEVFNLAKLADVWKKVNFGRYYLNTIIVVLGSMVCSVVFNGLLAYAVGILKPFGHKIINGLILLGYMVPAALAIFPLSLQIRATDNESKAALLAE